MSDESTRLRDWIGDVASGTATMSQRGERWVEQVGGIYAVIAAARGAGIHLVRLTNDKGNTLIAASREPFETLC